MSWRSALPVLGVALVWGVANTRAEETPVATDPEVIRLHLMDGSTIAGKLSVKDLEVETKFGKLQIPIVAVRSFTPGLGSHPELTGKVSKLIENLGSADYDEREAAQKSLRQMGEAIRPELQKHAEDTDKERRERIRALLEALDEELDDSDEEDPSEQWYSANDVIETNDFTVTGKITTGQFEVSSKYGPLKVSLSDIRRGERMQEKPEVLEKELKVDASNLVQRELKDVRIRVKRGDTIKISAEGQLTLTPWGRNAVSTPDGAGNYGWFVPNQIPAGMLIAAVGNNQQYLKVGTKETIVAPRSGWLKLGIAMMPEQANSQFPGMYNVKVVVERKP